MPDNSRFRHKVKSRDGWGGGHKKSPLLRQGAWCGMGSRILFADGRLFDDDRIKVAAAEVLVFAQDTGHGHGLPDFRELLRGGGRQVICLGGRIAAAVLQMDPVPPHDPCGDFDDLSLHGYLLVVEAGLLLEQVAHLVNFGGRRFLTLALFPGAHRRHGGKQHETNGQRLRKSVHEFLLCRVVIWPGTGLDLSALYALYEKYSSYLG